MNLIEKDVEKQLEKEYLVYKKLFNFGRKMEPGAKHLDIGCSIGTFPYRLAQDYPKISVYGVENDENRFETAVKSYNLPNLHFSKEIEKKHSYDTISTFRFLHEFKDPKSWLRKINKMLKRGGYLFAIDFRSVTVKEFRQEFKTWDKPEENFETEYKAHCIWSLKEFKEMAERAGFKTLKCQIFGRVYLSYLGTKDV